MRAALGALLALGCTLVIASEARAHRGSTKSILVEPTSTGANLEVQLDPIDVAVELGLPETTAPADLVSRASAIGSWVSTGIAVRCGAQTCRTSEAEVGSTDGRMQVRFAVRCPAHEGLVLEDRLVFDDDAQHESFVRERFGTGEETQILRRGRQIARIGAPASVGSLFARFVEEGILHLVTGTDHVLFVLSLLLTIGPRVRREGMRLALRDIAWVITAFTMGHSITLCLAALGWLTLPSQPVEVAIALSIALVAIWNLLRPEQRAALPWVALGFGLVHGLGFSGVLAEIGLPSQARVPSLLAFNVGLELAQLALVALVVPLLSRLALRETLYKRAIIQGGSLLITAVALAWTVERLMG